MMLTTTAFLPTINCWVSCLRFYEIAYFENKNGVSFVAIFIQQDGSYLVDSSGFEPDYVNKFNTKSEAIKFAKAYMRLH